MEPEYSEQSATGSYSELMNAVHNFPIHSHKIHTNIILSSTPRSLNILFHSDFPTKILYGFLIFLTCAKCPGHLILLDFIALIFGEVYKL